MNAWHLTRAVQTLRAGGILAYPTEAVWGLGCDPFNVAAVQRLLALKQRPMAKGLILVAAEVEQIAPLLVALTEQQRACLLQSWPGPHTWLLPDPDGWVPSWIKGSHASVAVRVSAHSGVKALCTAFNGPVVSTSANPAKRNPAKSQLKVSAYFGREIDYYLPGALGEQRQPSQIRDLLSQQLIRP